MRNKTCPVQEVHLQMGGSLLRVAFAGRKGQEENETAGRGLELLSQVAALLQAGRLHYGTTAIACCRAGREWLAAAQLQCSNATPAWQQ